jgi:predicted nucleic acid-binding protein
VSVFCVLDASATVPWCFPDEATDASAALLDRLSRDEVWVPSLWHFEVANVLLAAERRRRITAPLITDFLENLGGLAIHSDPDLERRLHGPVLAIARRLKLTVYDAAYLDVAQRRSLPLATRDKELRRAARTAGVTLIET